MSAFGGKADMRDRVASNLLSRLITHFGRK